VNVSIGSMLGNDRWSMSCVAVYWTGHVREQEMVFSVSEVLVIFLRLRTAATIVASLDSNLLIHETRKVEQE
jgi:hypothetical protein